MPRFQRADYALSEKLNQLSTEEFAESQRIRDKYGIPESVEDYGILRTMLIGVKVIYNRKRQRAIWWYQHTFDVVAVCVVLVVVLVAFFYFLR